MNGPEPAESLKLVQSLAAPTLVGNTDVEVAQAEDAVADWTRQQLGPEGLTYLKDLSSRHRVTSLSGTPHGDLLVFHASPRTCYDVMILEPHPSGTTFTIPTHEDDVLEMLVGEKAELMVFGHIHYASSRTVRGQHLASIGSVGFPLDGDTRAAYALAEWNSSVWQLEYSRVAYDHLVVVRFIEHSGQPLARRYARMIREARWERS